MFLLCRKSLRFARSWTHRAKAALFLLALALGLQASTALAQYDKASAPIPSATLALMSAKGSSPSAPLLLRAYKKESEIELWKRNGAGRFVHIKTYPICRWSGQLGPKTKEGDRQTPEGFYTVAKKQMNPNSAYYLSFDVGYPNALDRTLGRTGSAVMVHGICASMGCFAMTDQVAGELFAVAREAFNGGQGAFQFQSYPFRMSVANLARYRSDPNIGFWRQLKEGSDRFEATGLEPNATVAGGRYAFTPLRDPAQEALALKRVKDETERVANLIEDGAAAVRTTYSDGGQHPFWAAMISKGFPVGPVSRPEALAYAGQDVILIPARRKPVIVPMPETAWAMLIAPDTRFALPQAVGYVPDYTKPAPLFGPLVTRYSQTLPSLIHASLEQTVSEPPFTGASPILDVVAER